MPTQLFSLIKEIYGKEYPPDTSIRLLSTEHSTWQDSPQDSPSSDLMDISLLIASSDFYHIECQMENDKLMVIRMISYDIHYAIEHCMSQDSSADPVHPLFTAPSKALTQLKESFSSSKRIDNISEGDYSNITRCLNQWILTKQECNDYVDLLVHASRHIFYHYPKYSKKVQSMTKPLIYLPSMQIMDLKVSLAEKDS